METLEVFRNRLPALLKNPEMVKITVSKGEEQKTFMVHRDILSDACRNIETLKQEDIEEFGFTRPNPEVNAEGFVFEGHDPTAWQVIIAWYGLSSHTETRCSQAESIFPRLYTRELHLPPTAPCPNALERMLTKETPQKTPRPSVHNLSDAQAQYLVGILAWIIADHLDIGELKIRLINRLFIVLEEMPLQDLPTLSRAGWEICCGYEDDSCLWNFHTWYAIASIRGTDMLPHIIDLAIGEEMFDDSIRCIIQRRIVGETVSTTEQFCERFHEHLDSDDGYEACSAPVDLSKITRSAEGEDERVEEGLVRRPRSKAQSRRRAQRSSSETSSKA